MSKKLKNCSNAAASKRKGKRAHILNDVTKWVVGKLIKVYKSPCRLNEVVKARIIGGNGGGASWETNEWMIRTKWRIKKNSTHTHQLRLHIWLIWYKMEMFFYHSVFHLFVFAVNFEWVFTFVGKLKCYSTGQQDAKVWERMRESARRQAKSVCALRICSGNANRRKTIQVQNTSMFVFPLRFSRIVSGAWFTTEKWGNTAFIFLHLLNTYSLSSPLPLSLKHTHI